MEQAYLWVKAAHVASVIFWMAGLLYLPRLMAYHAAANSEPVTEGTAARGQMLQVMEKRLLKIITTPAMMVAWTLGLVLVFYDPRALGGWFLVKFAFVILLSAFHFFIAARIKSFARGSNTYSEKFFRRINEIPALGVLIVVVMVIVRPF